MVYLKKKYPAPAVDRDMVITTQKFIKNLRSAVPAINQESLKIMNPQTISFKIL